VGWLYALLGVAALLLLAWHVVQCVPGFPSLDTTAAFGQLHLGLHIHDRTAKLSVVRV